MWQYRELLKNLTIADLKNKYQNTALGFFWSILSPLAFALIMWFVFSNIFKQQHNFAVYILVGIMSWRFFANGTSMALVSVVGRPSLVTRVYIPRRILTVSTVLSSFVSAMLEFIILLPIIFVVDKGIPVTVVLFPFIHLLYLMIVLGVGFFLAALFVSFRDLYQIWEVLLNILFWASPCVYPLYLIGPKYMPYYMANPLTRILMMYRDIMVNGHLPGLHDFLIVAGFGIGALLIGGFVFDRLQRRFAEAI